jgi:hypothetical protein
MQQHKLEIKGKTFHKIHHFRRWRKLIRHAFTGININRVWKDDKTWFGQYATASCFKWVNSNAHIAARNVADTGRLIPGTWDFSRLLIK